MFNSGILDVAIGLIFVFLLVSLLVTIANEMVAAALLSRAKWLQKGITQLLGSTWMEKFYAHPLIQGTTAKGTIAKKAVGPSYIPSRAYATVLLDLVAEQDGAVSTARAALQNALDRFPTNTGSIASLKDAIRKAVDDVASKKLQVELQAMLDNMPSAADVPKQVASDIESTSALLSDPAFAGVKKILDDLAQKIRQDASTYDSKRLRDELDIAIKAIPYIGVTAEALKKDLRDLIQRIGETGYSVGDAKRDIQIFVNGLSDRYMRQMISQIADVQLQKTLTVLLDDAAHNVEKFKENIEVWFNNAMDRVGGWYKRRSQLTTFVLALLLTIVLNVDTLLIVRHLNTQPSVRDSLVAQAKAFAEHPPAGLQVTRSTSGSGSDPQSSSSSENNLPQSALEVEGGTAATGTISLGKPVADIGEITLSSSDNIVKVNPTTVAVKKGDTSIPFSITTEHIETPKFVHITASGAAEGRATVLIHEPRETEFQSIQSQLNQLSLPIGWFSASAENLARDAAQNTFRERNLLVLPRRSLDWTNYWSDWLRNISFHGIGWLLTALAASLGAPFWFDMLNKVMSIRSAGKAPEEKPKPPKEVPTPLEPGQSPREADNVNALQRR